MAKVFIDGSAGTTGLKIYERLLGRKDIELITLPDEVRKDPAYIKEAFGKADIAFLCLPDAAAVEAAELARGLGCRIIDTSTAHRTNKDWVYGFPELKGYRESIKNAGLAANPGCHASGFIALIEPLVRTGLIGPDARLTCMSVTGYSGGGKKMIAQYGDAGRDGLLGAPRVYGIGQEHKHLKEMKEITGLNIAPAFYPVVADYYSGMETNISLFKEDLKGSVDDIKSVYRELYNGPVVKYEETLDEGGFISALKMAGSDAMALTVTGNEERITLAALFDNLGKGASGAAIQNMNIMLGEDETKGLVLEGQAL